MARTTAVTAPVLHVIDALLQGGAEQVVVQLATRADQRRFDPAVATFRQEAYAAELAAAGRPVHVVPKRRRFDVALLVRLRRLIRRHGIALVHAHDIQSATYGALATRLTRVPLVLTVHGLGIFRQRRSRWLMPRIGRWAARVVFVGHWLRRVGGEEFAFRPRHPAVVHNGVDVATFAPGEPDPSLGEELGIEAGAPVVGSVGNLRVVKDYPCLLRAFAAARARVPDAVLVLVGEGPERATLETLAAELGLRAAVHFAGARGDVPRLLRRFDVYAVSSRTEGISIALLEAMATGLPAVATDTGGNPEVVVDGESGLLAPVGDSERLGGALGELLADADRRRAMGRAARQRVEAEFSLDQMVRNYERIYDTLLRR